MSYTVSSLFLYCINGLFGRNIPVDVKKTHKFFLFNYDNILLKILKATTQLGGF